MTTMTAPVRTLQDWLDELVAAKPDDRFAITNRALHAGGYTTSPVECTRCAPGQTMTFVHAHRHLVATENAFELEHPEARHPGGPRLHQVGDLVASSSMTQVRLEWSTTPCRFCQRPVIWAVTSTGGSIPIDPDPHASGNVVLSVPPGGSFADRPLATFLGGFEAERVDTRPDNLRTRHAATCTNWRRR